MIFTTVRDGLGNQMFIYAAARQLQKHTGEKIYLDTHIFKYDKTRLLELTLFKLNRNVRRLKTFGENGVHIYSSAVGRILRGKAEYGRMGLFYPGSDGFLYRKINEKAKIKLLNGSFQNPNYFPDIEAELKAEFSPAYKLSEKVSDRAEEIKRCESVCVHIRRGDYVSDSRWSEVLEVCTRDYYIKAMKYILSKKPDAVFYVFSNSHEDIEWIKSNYDFSGFVVRYVDMNNTSVDELMIMKSCKNFVISNSTFSWWAQYLSENGDKIVCAPSVWHRKNSNSAVMTDKDKMTIIDV